MKNKHVLVTVTGPDNPGITATIMEHIVAAKCEISDMGQSVTHGLLSLSILIDFKGGEDNSPLIKDLLFASKSLGVNLDFDVIENGDNTLITRQEKHILSCVSSDYISSAFLLDVANTLSKYKINIQTIEKISDENFTSLDLKTTSSREINWSEVKLELMSVSNKHLIDLALLKNNVFRYNKRLIVFDMDSTLIQSEVIDEMAEVHGVGAQVREITEKAMNGEMNFDESLKARVKLLAGLEEEKLSEILSSIKYTEGVEEFVKTVKSLGYKLAVISGGFNFFAQAFRKRLGFDYAFANDLEILHGKLTGEILGPIVNADQKAMLLELIAMQESISLEQVVAIGDGANDLKMLAKAGLGIAFHAKEIVRKNAGSQISHGPMTNILSFLGIPKEGTY